MYIILKVDYYLTKIALITDLHIGARSDNSFVYQNMIDFYHNDFFPELKKRGIKTIINLGDTFDRRKLTNNKTLQDSKIDIFSRFNEFDCHFIIGNHDTSFRSTNKVNTVKSNLVEFSNIKAYEDPVTVNIEGLNICMIPWINPENHSAAMKEIENTQAVINMGHYEITGFEFHTGSICKHGLSSSIFQRFNQTFSGHFHKKSNSNNITYLGSPYQTTWHEHKEIKGFHIFDTKTFELEFVPNSNQLFLEITTDFDFSEKLENRFIRLVSTEEFSKTKDYEFLREKIQDQKPASFTTKLIDRIKLPSEIDTETIEVNDLDIMNISKEYVDGIENLTNKYELNSLLEELYRDATK